MWVYLSDSFLSIVAHDSNPNMLLVRARKQGDIEHVFPKARVRRTPRADYLYRALVKRSVVAAALMREVLAIDYPNFKNSVPDDNRHDAYQDCWSAMYRWGYLSERIPA